MDQQQEGVAYAEPTPDDNQQPTATSSNAAGNPPTVTLEMLMQVLNTRMDEQKRDINAKMEEQKEDNKGISQDLKDLALKLDQSIEYFKNANNDFRGEVVTSTRTQSSRNQVVDQKVKFNQIHGEETSHYQDEIGTTPDLSQKTETESGQNSIQKTNDHTQEDEDIEKPVTVLEEILPIRTEILEVPLTQELHEDECKAHNFTEEGLLPEHIHDAKKFQKPPMEVFIDYDVLQVNRNETVMEGIQFGMDRESCLSFHYYPEPERRITLLRPHIFIALNQKSPRIIRTNLKNRSSPKIVLTAI
ncbi:hypothetical protein AC249_AIPGENE13513 [Exaiptasia diaphana]|nr:hypothetical protein AC249_AIPGENE13513 [Exaiptasia diaphana]